MAFTRALFYPTIDIENENWLKTAILFWDEISTIVPVSIDNPYQECATQYLHDIGLLTPIEVTPELEFIEELAEDTMNYLNTNEGFQLLTQGENKYTIHRDKLPRDISRLFDIHPEKLPYEQMVEDVYVNEFLPGYNGLKKALNGSGIKWVSDNFMKVSFISTGATALPIALLGLSIPYALLASAGISIISSLISYNVDKTTTLRNNPYSYLLAVNNGL